MQFVSVENPLSFEVTYDDPALFVAMSVYDDTGVSPILVQGPATMANVVGNTYRGKFTPTFNKTYIVFKAVYTDGTFTTLHPDYSNGSESFRCEKADIASGQIVVKKNQALGDFPFIMLGTVSQEPDEGLTVVATRSIDGAAFAACANAVIEISDGWYKIDLAASDLNGDTIALNFAATGATVTAVTIVTQP